MKHERVHAECGHDEAPTTRTTKISDIDVDRSDESAAEEESAGEPSPAVVITRVVSVGDDSDVSVGSSETA